MICKPLDLVVVPFPFSDKAAAKKRPALVLSAETCNRHGHTVLAMVTSSGHRPWPGDCPIRNLEQAGLATSCLVRLKLFTLDNRLILRTLGHLAPEDAAAVRSALRAALADETV